MNLRRFLFVLLLPLLWGIASREAGAYIRIDEITAPVAGSYHCVGTELKVEGKYTSDAAGYNLNLYVNGVLEVSQKDIAPGEQLAFTIPWKIPLDYHVEHRSGKCLLMVEIAKQGCVRDSRDVSIVVFKVELTSKDEPPLGIVTGDVAQVTATIKPSRQFRWCLFGWKTI